MTKILSQLLLFIALLTAQSVCAQVEFHKIRRSGNLESEQIYLTLSSLPRFTTVQKAKRVDLILDTPLTGTATIDFPVDDRIVKFLTHATEKKTIFTFFFRYEPQRITLSTPQKNTLVLDILLGNQFTKEYPDLSSKLQGLTIVKNAADDYSNPLFSCPYTNNWLSFFSKYEPEITTTAPIKFTVPPFPLISLLPLTDSEITTLLPAEIFTLAQQDLWEDMVPLLLELINKESDLDRKKQLALTFGEALFRSAHYNGAFKQLYLLKEKYIDDAVGNLANYLLILLRAEFEDPYVAEYEARQLEKYVSENLPISPYLYLVQLETALATNQLKRAHQLLQKDNVALPDELVQLKELRQSDYWYAGDEYLKAFIGYDLIRKKDIFLNSPYSLNGYCNTLYRQNNFEEAATCFQQLSTLITNKHQLSVISLKKAMAEQHFKSRREMYVIYSTLEDSYPDTISGFRAALKKTDIRYLSQPGWQKTSAKYYKALYQKTSDKEVAEEAALKEAIVYALLDDRSKSISLLLDFLRNFRKSQLVKTAQALLIEQLPGEIQKLVEEENFIDGLVLAKKNREFFQKNWIEADLLAILAKAYQELGIYKEAKNLYLYLMKTNDMQQKKPYYLPLISIYYALGKHGVVEDFATQYSYNYPEGDHLDEILLLRLQSLMADNKSERALDIVSTNLPDNKEIKEIAASIFFMENRFADVSDSLMPYWRNETLQSEMSQFILAESLYQQGRLDDSEQLFITIKETRQFFDQSRYRLAGIARGRGDQQNALKLFEEIVEKGNDHLWQRLARKELEFHTLTEKF